MDIAPTPPSVFELHCESAILEGQLEYLKYYQYCGGRSTQRLIDAAITYGKETGDYTCYHQIMMDVMVDEVNCLTI